MYLEMYHCLQSVSISREHLHQKFPLSTHLPNRCSQTSFHEMSRYTRRIVLTLASLLYLRIQPMLYRTRGPCEPMNISNRARLTRPKGEPIAPSLSLMSVETISRRTIFIFARYSPRGIRSMRKSARGRLYRAHPREDVIFYTNQTTTLVTSSQVTGDHAGDESKIFFRDG